MAWKAYKVVLRLRSPLHIGAGKVGNLQRTRHYIAGRNLWGALTARMTRNGHKNGKPAPKAYKSLGDRLHNELAFTYFYPTTNKQGSSPLFPFNNRRGSLRYGLNGAMMDAAAFRYRFLSTYASTALNYTGNSAEEASLHEVECVLPHSRDDQSAQVYLTGYIFQEENSDLEWKKALRHLQIGGERGYGWGRLEVEDVEIQDDEISIFGTKHTVRLDEDAVKIHLEKGQPVLAHTLAVEFESGLAVPNIDGSVKPLVGRETREADGFGVNLSLARICYPPGARVIAEGVNVKVGKFGVWEGA